MDDSFYNYVFDISDELIGAERLSAYREIIESLRREFQYFYPVDLRCSGKDLVTNHLSFFIFNHVATWAKNSEYWPRGLRANGFLQMNGEKMSKSKGTFLTSAEAIDRYSADGLRLALTDAGDGSADANLNIEVANASIERLHQLF